MAFDNVPWMIANGAHHSADLARSVAFLATGGNEGVGSPGDFRVHEMDVPGTKAVIDPGVVAFLNRHVGATSGQSYVGRAGSETEVDITATGSGSTRSDMVIVRAEDPAFSPWPAVPEVDRPNWPYFKPFVVEDVDPTAIRFSDLDLDYAGYALARIDLPVSTGTIIDDYVVDLRDLIQPKSERFIDMAIPTVEDTLTGNPEDPWPNFTTSVKIPIWATKAQIRCVISMVGHRTGPVTGNTSIKLGTGGGQMSSANLIYDFDAPNAGDRRVLDIVGTFTGAAFRAMQGTTQTIRTVGAKTAGTGHLVTVAGTHMSYDVQFSEEPI